MTSDSNERPEVEKSDEYWDRWSENLFEPTLFKPMKKPLTVPWDLAVSDSDIEKLKAGFRPKNLDDKYAFLIEDDNGSISIHITRYYIKVEEFILHITPKSSNDDSASAKIHSITWDGESVDVKDDEEKVKKRIVLLSRDIVKCDFENAPGTV